MIRVMIADDHVLVRHSLRALLEQAQDVEVVGEAADGSEAVALARALQPDVVVMDVAMPQLDGIKATERIRDLNLPTQVLILSIYADSILVEQALRKGARGYLLKRAASEELLPAIHQVQNGEIYLGRSLTGLTAGP